MSVQNEGDGLLQDAVASGDVPGVVAVATSRDGTIYEGGFGERVLGGGMAMTPDTVGWIASTTKALTGTAAMQLVERGKLDLDRPAARGRRLGRLRLAVVPDVPAASLEGFLGQNVARPATVATDGWSGYGGLAAAGYRHEPVNLSASWGDAALRLPAIHLVFSLAKRWLLGTHHGAVRAKHLPAYLDEFTSRFNRRTATSISHRFARVVEHAVQLPPTTYRALVATPT